MEGWTSEWSMETVVALGVLATVFIGALLSLVMVCRHKSIRNKTADYIHKISGAEGLQFDNKTLLDSDLELGEVCLHPYIEQILLTEQWTADASGLITHCLEIVKLCRRVTNLIAALTVGHQNAKTLCDIVQVAKRISVRVDDVVRTMYPPLDTCLLEARCLALVLAVTQLTLVARHGLGHEKANMLSADQSLVEMELHLMVLREAALAHEAACCIQSASNKAGPPASTV